MTTIATPNWLAIAGFIHLLFAFGLALNGMARSAPAGSLLQRTRAEAGRRIDAVMAMPFLAVGMCCLVGAQLVSMALNPTLVVLILSAPMALLLYLGFEGLWVEDAVADIQADAPQKPLLRLPSPAPATVHTLPTQATETPVVADLARSGAAG